MMLAQRWTGQPVAGWWLSEKFDGVRAFWDGAALRTRTWRAIEAPAWFTAALPKGVALDGELWGGRGTFQLASELSRFSRSADPAWRSMRFKLFDWPTTDAVTIEDRVARASAYAKASARLGASHVQFVEPRKCLSNDEADETMHSIVRLGGEGAMLKRPGSFYAFGRSANWLKVKPAGVA